jgi:hypothetical protein
VKILILGFMSIDLVKDNLDVSERQYLTINGKYVSWIVICDLSKTLKLNKKGKSHINIILYGGDTCVYVCGGVHARECIAFMCLDAFVCACVRACAHVCICVCVRVYVYVCRYMCMHAYMFICVRMYRCVHVYVCTGMYICMYICGFIHNCQWK